MKTVITLVFAAMCLSCMPKNENSKEKLVASLYSKACTSYDPQTNLYTSFNYFNNNTNPYNTKLRLQPSKENNYNLVIDMELNNGAYFVSPNSKRNFKGKFTVTFQDAPHITLIDKLIEYPLSVEEYDEHPFVNGKVNWVRENTTYTQKIKVITDKDFTVMGTIQFTIEPRCTLEKIPIVIFQKDGKLKFEIDNC